MRLPIGRIGIVAPSSKVPQVELKLGVTKLRQAGFQVDVHAQCKKSHLFFAGTDEERSSALIEYAENPHYSVIWCARGGSGAIRLLPWLDQWTARSKKPSHKLLIGYSDSTVIMEYVRKRWGWSILHAPMPSMRKFSLLDAPDWLALESWIQKKPSLHPWSQKKLKFWAQPRKQMISGTLLGGNLTVWCGLTGTPYQPRPGRNLLFFEDVDESLYRIDRMVQQQILSGAWDQVQAIVLGNFMNCRDHAPSVLRGEPSAEVMNRVLTTPSTEELKPLRKTFSQEQGLQKIWSDVGQRLGIPVAYGLPVGHGPEVSPLPLGAQYRLHPEGYLELVKWNWF
jgi:muramoyltetrapeptide carboxypeptidase